MKVNIEFKNITIKAKVVSSKKDMTKGLSGTESLPKKEGMLFVWNKETNSYMVMKDMNYDLDFIFLDKDNKVLDIKSADKDFKEDIKSDKPFNAILEINKGESKNIEIGEIAVINAIKDIVAKKTGGSLEFTEDCSLVEDEDEIRLFKTGGQPLTANKSKALKIGDVVHQIKIKDVPLKPNHLYLLNNDGEVVYNINGKEIIFSIPHTSEIVEKSVKAESDNDLEELGEIVVGILEKHKNQEELYVKR